MVAAAGSRCVTPVHSPCHQRPGPGGVAFHALAALVSPGQVIHGLRVVQASGDPVPRCRHSRCCWRGGGQRIRAHQAGDGRLGVSARLAVSRRCRGSEELASASALKQQSPRKCSCPAQGAACGGWHPAHLAMKRQHRCQLHRQCCRYCPAAAARLQQDAQVAAGSTDWYALHHQAPTGAGAMGGPAASCRGPPWSWWS